MIRDDISAKTNTEPDVRASIRILRDKGNEVKPRMVLTYHSAKALVRTPEPRSDSLGKAGLAALPKAEKGPEVGKDEVDEQVRGWEAVLIDI